MWPFAKLRRTLVYVGAAAIYFYEPESWLLAMQFDLPHGTKSRPEFGQQPSRLTQTESDFGHFLSPMVTRQKLEFNGSTFLVSSWHPRGSRTCRARMLRGSSRRCPNKLHVSSSWILENDTTHGRTGSTYNTAADRRPAGRPTNHRKRVACWTSGSRLTCPTRRHPREDLRKDVGVSARMPRGCYTRKLLPWNLSFSKLRL